MSCNLDRQIACRVSPKNQTYIGERSRGFSLEQPVADLEGGLAGAESHGMAAQQEVTRGGLDGLRRRISETGTSTACSFSRKEACLSGAERFSKQPRRDQGMA